MVQGFSFRAGAALIVGAYVVIVGLLVLASGHDLWRPVGHYVPQVSWLMPETTTVRIAALRLAGEPGTAALYALVAAISWGLISALAAGGFAWGTLNKGATLLGVDKAINYVTALVIFYAIAKSTEVALHALQAGGLPQGGISAMPGMWFATLIPSAAILARLGALLAHDAGSLIAVAIEADPDRLAALVSASEERRGPDSLEAKLARRIARRSKTA